MLNKNVPLNILKITNVLQSFNSFFKTYNYGFTLFKIIFFNFSDSKQVSVQFFSLFLLVCNNVSKIYYFPREPHITIRHSLRQMFCTVLHISHRRAKIVLRSRYHQKGITIHLRTMRILVILCNILYIQIGLTLEFLSYKILENFMRNEFRISRKNTPCFAKFRVSRNKLLHAKDSFVCFVFRETEHYHTKRNY